MYTTLTQRSALTNWGYFYKSNFLHRLRLLLHEGVPLQTVAPLTWKTTLTDFLHEGLPLQIDYSLRLLLHEGLSLQIDATLTWRTYLTAWGYSYMKDLAYILRLLLHEGLPFPTEATLTRKTTLTGVLHEGLPLQPEATLTWRTVLADWCYSDMKDLPYSLRLLLHEGLTFQT